MKNSKIKIFKKIAKLIFFLPFFYHYTTYLLQGEGNMFQVYHFDSEAYEQTLILFFFIILDCFVSSLLQLLLVLCFTFNYFFYNFQVELFYYGLI